MSSRSSLFDSGKAGPAYDKIWPVFALRRRRVSCYDSPVSNLRHFLTIVSSSLLFIKKVAPQVGKCGVVQGFYSDSQVFL